MIKGITLFFIIALACSFMSCGIGIAILSHSLKISTKINSKFMIGKANDIPAVGRCLWYMEDESKPNPAEGWEGDTQYLLLFQNPTDVKCDSNFIILKRELPHRAVRFLIAKIGHDRRSQIYDARNEMIYNRLRKKLGIADSLKFE